MWQARQGHPALPYTAAFPPHWTNLCPDNVGPQPAEPSERLPAAASAVRRPWPLPALALLAPVVEEYLFRGLLQGALLQRPRLARRWFGISGANVLVSIAFAAAHLWSRPSTAAVAVLLPSLALGACRERYGILAPCMVLHAFWNAGFVWLFA